MTRTGLHLFQEAEGIRKCFSAAEKVMVLLSQRLHIHVKCNFYQSGVCGAQSDGWVRVSIGLYYM